MTLILGATSASLALVILAVTFGGILNGRGSDWLDPRVVGQGVKIYVPSPYTVGIGMLGIAFGLLGIIFSWRLGKLSWLSVFGIAIILIALWGAAIHEIIVVYK